jgi:hypothetical protein
MAPAEKAGRSCWRWPDWPPRFRRRGRPGGPEFFPLGRTIPRDGGFEELPECSRTVASSVCSAATCAWSLSTSSRKGSHRSQVGGIVDFVILTKSYPGQNTCLRSPLHLVLLAGCATQGLVSARHWPLRLFRSCPRNQNCGRDREPFTAFHRYRWSQNGRPPMRSRGLGT